MKKLLSLLLFCLLATSSLATPTPEELKTVRKAIRVIQESPYGLHDEAVATVLAFAQKSPDVVVITSPEAMPWRVEEFRNRGPDRYTEVTAIYTAGCLLHQLSLGHADPNPFVGWVWVLRNYKKRSRPVTYFESPGLDKLRALDDQGKLEEYAAQIVEKYEAERKAHPSPHRP